MKKSFFVIAFLLIINSLYAQSPYKVYEDSLKNLFNYMSTLRKDTLKYKTNQDINRILNNVLSEESSFAYPFDSLKYLGKITSKDKRVRVITWNVSNDDGTYRYFGYIQYFTDKKKFSLIPLTDKSDEITEPKKETLTPARWFGALYYQIIDNDNYYTLLGWDGNDMFTNKKIIEILSFTKNGDAKFGLPVIIVENKTLKRAIFEYSKRANMLLKYYEKDKRIVHDHLSPSDSKYQGQFQYYGPDFSYDALYLKKGKWVYQADIDFKNPDVSPQKKKKSLDKKKL